MDKPDHPQYFEPFSLQNALSQRRVRVVLGLILTLLLLAGLAWSLTTRTPQWLSLSEAEFNRLSDLPARDILSHGGVLFQLAEDGQTLLIYPNAAQCCNGSGKALRLPKGMQIKDIISADISGSDGLLLISLSNYGLKSKYYIMHITAGHKIELQKLNIARGERAKSVISHNGTVYVAAYGYRLINQGYRNFSYIFNSKSDQIICTSGTIATRRSISENFHPQFGKFPILGSIGENEWYHCNLDTGNMSSFIISSTSSTDGRILTSQNNIEVLSDRATATNSAPSHVRFHSQPDFITRDNTEHHTRWSIQGGQSLPYLYSKGPSQVSLHPHTFELALLDFPPTTQANTPLFERKSIQTRSQISGDDLQHRTYGEAVDVSAQAFLYSDAVGDLRYKCYLRPEWEYLEEWLGGISNEIEYGPYYSVCQGKWNDAPTIIE